MAPSWRPAGQPRRYLRRRGSRPRSGPLEPSGATTPAGCGRRGGCLLCINVDSESRACLSAAGDHAVLIDDASQLLAPRVTSGLRPEVRDGTYLGLVGGAPQTQLKALDTA